MFEARFQSFEDPAERAASGPRLAALRTELARRDLTGFVVPRADRHQDEYLPACEERLAWLTGFTGTAGLAIVLPDRAVLFVDGRYTLQARQQVDASLFAIEHLIESPPDRWIETNLASGDRLAYDPWLHTVEGAERLRKACAATAATLIAVERNLIDEIWTDRPSPPLGAVTLHELRFAGEPAEHKRERITAELTRLRADALVISDPHSVAWTFNIRGADVAHTPLPLSFAIVPRLERPSIYIDDRKLSNDVRHGLEILAEVRAPGDFEQALTMLGRQKGTVRIDRASAADALARLINTGGGTVVPGLDPVALMKSVKNETEIAGARPDGAIVHYRVTIGTNRMIVPGELFLIDSGGQYEDGTTDITRTVAVGEPSAEMRARFTLVLKGHIAIARSVFPDGTTGAQLDSFARQYLWEAGLEFDHGTGHGVGSYLSVHEGPARISRLGVAALKRGVILSNEPGYYKAGAYGIRIENLLLVVEAPQISGAEKPLNAFETLTLA